MGDERRRKREIRPFDRRTRRGQRPADAFGLAHALKLVHFHVGSQVPDIGTIKRATKEAARFYSKLQKMGHELGYLDVGGGLGVDYDGSRTTFDSSTNYSLNEYARDIVYSIMEVCDAEGVPHPTIVSESGRAIVAHHSILIVEAFGSIEKSPNGEKMEAAADDPQIVHDIVEIFENLGRKNRLENLHDAHEIRERAQAMFDLGLLDLRAKARIETVYWQIAGAVVAMFQGMRYCAGRSEGDGGGPWETSSFAIFRCSNPSSTIGRSGSCFPCCQSTG